MQWPVSPACVRLFVEGARRFSLEYHVCISKMILRNPWCCVAERLACRTASLAASSTPLPCYQFRSSRRGGGNHGFSVARTVLKTEASLYFGRVDSYVFGLRCHARDSSLPDGCRGFRFVRGSAFQGVVDVCGRGEGGEGEGLVKHHVRQGEFLRRDLTGIQRYLKNEKWRAGSKARGSDFDLERTSQRGLLWAVYGRIILCARMHPDVRVQAEVAAGCVAHVVLRAVP